MGVVAGPPGFIAENVSAIREEAPKNVAWPKPPPPRGMFALLGKCIGKSPGANLPGGAPFAFRKLLEPSSSPSSSDSSSLSAPPPPRCLSSSARVPPLFSSPPPSSLPSAAVLLSLPPSPSWLFSLFSSLFSLFSFSSELAQFAFRCSSLPFAADEATLENRPPVGKWAPKVGCRNPGPPRRGPKPTETPIGRPPKPVDILNLGLIELIFSSVPFLIGGLSPICR
mmetsp:Transcript_557/g.997  ORF Transcript_557/g.997 Transcript_557/m.997 type:complete len:225 (-) Transcript_557:1087-1761(-)